MNDDDNVQPEPVDEWRKKKEEEEEKKEEKEEEEKSYSFPARR